MGCIASRLAASLLAMRMLPDASRTYRQSCGNRPCPNHTPAGAGWGANCYCGGLHCFIRSRLLVGKADARFVTNRQFGELALFERRRTTQGILADGLDGISWTGTETAMDSLVRNGRNRKSQAAFWLDWGNYRGFPAGIAVSRKITVTRTPQHRSAVSAHSTSSAQ